MGWGSYSAASASHVKLLVSHLTKKNAKATASELHAHAAEHGTEAYVVLLRTLFEQVGDLRETNNANSNKEGLRAAKLQLLAEFIEALVARPHFPSLVCRALAFTGSELHREEFLSELTKALDLPFAWQLTLALALAESAIDPGWRTEGLRHLQACLLELIQSYQSGGEEALRDKAASLSLGDSLLHRLLALLARVPEASALHQALLALRWR
jgi:hypothetical protein